MVATPPKLASIGFRAGAGASEEPVVIEAPEVVVLVGPNNSGKSLALREIENWCVGAEQERLVIGDLKAEFPTEPNEAIELVRRFESDPPEGLLRQSDRLWVGQHTFRPSGEVLHRDIHIESLREWTKSQNERQLREYVLHMYTVRLDGRTRFSLSDPKPSGDLQRPPQNHLWALFQDDKSRRRVRGLTQEAFGRSFVIDPTAMTHFRIRLSDRPPRDRSEEQALDQRARTFHSESPLASELSDGVQAFVGLVSAVMSLPHSVLLIDEPEAFLHPPLARRLGRDLAMLTTERSAVLVVATHSADFLMGCVMEAPRTAIARLTYDGDIATARSLDADSVRELMRDPLLRSTRALQGLFHRSVVVTEADADRAFYDEANRRLTAVGRGIEDCLFVSAQNWQTVPRILEPLRRVGVPAAGVFDLDVIANTESWSGLLKSARVPATLRDQIMQLRSECRKDLRAAGNYKKLGRQCLPTSRRRKLDGLFRRLERFGLFVVPVGELEGWLSGLGVGARKDRWLAAVFERMGSDPHDSDYVWPSRGDVWAFLDRIDRWTSDPLRGGMGIGTGS